MDNSINNDRLGPMPAERPASTQEICALVRRMRASNYGLYPVGGRTKLDIGYAPYKPGIACDMTALQQVIDYPARDMTITVQAGLGVGALQAVLGKEGQQLPVDIAMPQLATIGGALATNSSGPRRYGQGTLRDYVIGISFITDHSVEVKGGGRVVKNVAGYDLMKLHIGALGTLGVITQVTLKVKPKPEAGAAVIFRIRAEAIAENLNLLAASHTRPAAVELLNHFAAAAASQQYREIPIPDRNEWLLVVAFEHSQTAVNWQVSKLKDELRKAAIHDLTESRNCELLDAITDLQLRPASNYICKASVLPSRLAEIAKGVAGDVPCPVHAHALNGLLWIHSPEGTEATSSSIAAWHQHVRSRIAGNSYFVRRCPPAEQAALRIWESTGGMELMKRIKQTLDPDDLFNPGRLFANG